MWINGVWHFLKNEELDNGSDLGGGTVVDGGTTNDGASDGAIQSDGTTDGDAGKGGSPLTGDWPTDWRTKFSPDGKHQKTLDRFASPNALFDSYMALRQKLDSGEFKSAAAFPNKGTDEEKVAWRKANGIPEKAEDYAVKLPEGLVISEEDKPVVDSFLARAHEINATPDQVNQMLDWYYANQEEMISQREDKDGELLTSTEDALRSEWGAEYRANVNMLKGLVDTIPESVRELFANARLSDGTPVFSHPEMARWFVHAARTINPVASIVPGAGANMASAIEDEISAIEKTMRTDRKAYNNDSKMQARLRELYDARQRAKS